MTRLAAARTRQPAGRTAQRAEVTPWQVPSAVEPAVCTPDWELIVGANRPNTLLVGPDGAPEALLHAVGGFLARPVFVWPDDGRPWRCRAAFKTLVLRGVSALDAGGQASLLSWIAGPGAGVQIISLAHCTPYALVERGTFLEALYYRLNVVCLRCQPPRPRRLIRRGHR